MPQPARGWRAVARHLCVAAGFVMAFVSLSVHAENVLIVAGPDEPADAGAALTPRLAAKGHTVTQLAALPEDVSSYQQIWDLTANASMTAGDRAKYVAFLAAGKRAFIMGENTSWGASRNASIETLLVELGVTGVTIGPATSAQTIASPWNGGASEIDFPAAGAFLSAGSGTFITRDTVDPTRGTGLAFSPGSMSNAAAGTLAMVLDIGFLKAENVARLGNVALGDALIGYVGGTITEPFSVTTVAGPAAGSYKAGDNLDFVVNLRAVATVTGTPRLAITVGGTTRYANYVSGSGSATLVFQHVIQAEDNDNDGITVSSIDLNGGTIKNAQADDALLTFTAPSTTAVLVDNQPPTVTSSVRHTPATPAANTSSVVFRVTFSEPVSGVGAVDFALTSAGVSATIGGVSAVSASVYDVTVSDVSGIGSLRLDVLANGVADAAGHVLVDAFESGQAYAVDTSVQFPIVANFDGADNAALAAAGWLLAGDATAVDDRLQLTRPLNVLAGTAIFNQPFASTVGVNVQFEYEMSGGTGADGLAFFLVDGAQTTPTSGGAGPAFGYAYGGDAVAGASLGYLGVGFDLWGNYTSTISFHDGLLAGETKNRIALRGPATLTDSNGTKDEYDYVVGSAVEYAVAGSRKVNLTITPDGHITLLVSADGGAHWTTIYEDFDFASSAAFSGYSRPAMLKLGFGASTGGSNNLHAIDNVTVRKPADHTIKFTSAPVEEQPVGATVSYTLTITNAGWNDDPSARLTYTVPATLTNVAWSYAVDGGAATTGTSSSIDETFALAAGKTAVFVVQGTVAAAAAGTTIAQTASIAPSAAFGDLDPASNVAVVGTAVLPRPVVSSALTATGAYRAAFTYQAAATNNPTSFAATGLPAGLTLNPATGVISGAPSEAGTFAVALSGSNASGAGTEATLEITIAKAPLTVTARDVVRSVGSTTPALTVEYTGFLGGDTASSLTTEPSASSNATADSPAGTYVITVAGGVSSNYSFNYVNGTLTLSVSKESQSINFASIPTTIVGRTVTLSATASSGLPVSFTVVSGPATQVGNSLTTTGVGEVTVRASQSGNASYNSAASVLQSFLVIGAPPVVGTPTAVPEAPVGGTATLTVPQSNSALNYQWQRNGADLSGATSATLALNNVQPANAGLYTYVVGSGDGPATPSVPVIVGVTTTDKVAGTGEVVNADIRHPNGATYDQLILEGTGATLTADQGQVTRMSFNDLSDDIVQVEFSGAGSLSLVMDDASAPAPAARYNQPGVNYVRGNVGIVITGANETTNVSVVSVGRITAVNQTLFRDDVAYDGVANIAFIAIQSANGKFGAIRTGNVEYFARQGVTGIYAPGVQFTGPVYVGDIQAYDGAQPMLVLGSAADIRITGGSLEQPNGSPVAVQGLSQVNFTAGRTSHGDTLPVQSNHAVLEQDGIDVTDLLVTQ